MRLRIEWVEGAVSLSESCGDCSEGGSSGVDVIKIAGDVLKDSERRERRLSVASVCLNSQV